MFAPNSGQLGLYSDVSICIAMSKISYGYITLVVYQVGSRSIPQASQLGHEFNSCPGTESDNLINFLLSAFLPPSTRGILSLVMYTGLPATGIALRCLWEMHSLIQHMAGCMGHIVKIMHGPYR